MNFREIDRTNYWDCMALTIDESQEGFVADNKQSLGFAEVEEIEHTVFGRCFREMRMVKEL